LRHDGGANRKPAHDSRAFALHLPDRNKSALG
jgi:hypothetical protein